MIGAEYNQSDLARAMGVTPQTVQQWLADRTSPRRARIDKLSQELGCDSVWLETGYRRDATHHEGAAEPQDIVANPVADTIPVRYYPGVPASAGFGCVPVSEANVTMMDVARVLLRQKSVQTDRAVLLQADGDSMTGTVDHGDLMLIDTSDTNPREGRVYIVSIDGDVLVKRVQRIPRGIKLISDNPAYDPITVMEADQDTSIQLIGRVVLAWSSRDML